jgi:positive regulator of sigma E activity
LTKRLATMNRERRDYILISVALLIAAIAMYLNEENGWILALTMAISAVGTFGAYWLARRYKKSHPGNDSGARDSRRD